MKWMAFGRKTNHISWPDWIVEVNLAPIWRGQSDNLAESPIWFNLAAQKKIQSGQSGKNKKLPK